MSRYPLQILVFFALTFAFFLAWDFSQRAVVTTRLDETDQQLTGEIARAKETRAELVALKTRVASEAFVDDQMRRQGWGRPEDTVVQVLITPAPTPAATPTPRPTPTPEPSWWDTLIKFLIP
ncbi:hypothetical protein ANRL3_00387 [Anaerolineae bacterium]|nr:hypothetical protein ANRL3_00387 [Anaerolineae bacterium]